MEIEFNPGRVPRAGYNTEMVSRREVARRPDNSDAASVQSDRNLQQQQLSPAEVRPEKVAEAKALVADEKYPPDYLLDRIAVLLAIQTRPQDTKPE